MELGFKTVKDVLEVVIVPSTLAVLAILGREFYESWQLRGIYVSSVPATGSAPGVEWTEVGHPSSITWGIQLGILNTTDRLLAVERVAVRWPSVRGPGLAGRQALRDPSATVIELDAPMGREKDQNYLPVLVQGKGGVAYVQVRAALRFQPSYPFVHWCQHSPAVPIEQRSDGYFWNVMRFVEKKQAVIALRIGGKIRRVTVRV